MAGIGVQLMMVRDKIAADGMRPVLQRVADLGYTCVEVSQVPTDAANIAALDAARHDLGLDVAALSVGLKKGPTTTGDALDSDFAKVVEDCHRLDCRYLRIGMMPFDAMVSKDAVVRFAEDAEDAARRLAEHGITLAYHNHHVDFAKHDGETLFDIVRRTSPSLHFEIDVHWVQRGGRNPVDVLAEFAGIVELVHLKDYRVATLPPSGLELLQAGDFAGFMQAFTGLVQFAEVGAGTIDFARVVPQALASGAEYLLVEQDDLYGRDAYDCLADSRAHLRTLGY
ncbi:MAG: sugar phosphate isomerase/epimerase [Actinobacteria bacterium]|nr:sugar phosphate isomerase/epimerase [Actinomycetota bacterium]